MINFLIGLCVGCGASLFYLSLCNAAKKGDETIEHFNENSSTFFEDM